MGRGDGQQRASLSAPRRSAPALAPSYPDGNIAEGFIQGKGWGWRQGSDLETLFDRNGVAVVMGDAGRGRRRIALLFLSPDAAGNDAKLNSFFESTCEEHELPEALPRLQRAAQRLVVLKQGGWSIDTDGDSASKIFAVADGKLGLKLGNWKSADDRPYAKDGGSVLTTFERHLDELPTRAEDLSDPLARARKQLDKEQQAAQQRLWQEMAEARFGELDDSERQEISKKATKLRAQHHDLGDDEILDRARQELLSPSQPNTERLRRWAAARS